MIFGDEELKRLKVALAAGYDTPCDRVSALLARLDAAEEIAQLDFETGQWPEEVKAWRKVAGK